MSVVSKFSANSLSIIYHYAIHNLLTFRENFEPDIFYDTRTMKALIAILLLESPPVTRESCATYANNSQDITRILGQ